MNAEDKEKQTLLADAVAELQRTSAELERKSAEYDRKTAEYGRKIARLEKITKLVQQQNQHQPPQHRSIRGGREGDATTNMISDLSFMSASDHVGDDDDGSTLFFDHPRTNLTPPMMNQRNNNPSTKKKTGGGIFGYGGWIDADSNSRGGYSDHEEEHEESNQGLSLTIIRDDNSYGEVSKQDDEVDDHTDAMERGVHRQEFNILWEKVASIDKIVNEQQEPAPINDGSGKLDRKSLLTHLPSAMRLTLFQEDSKQTFVLDRDSFTLMVHSRWYSKAWLLGIFSFLFQMSLLIFGPLNYYTNEINITDKLLAPMSRGFLAVKWLVLFLCLITQNDILSSVHCIISMRTVDDVNLSKIIDEEVERVIRRRRYLWISRILIPNILKIIQGVLVLVVTFFVVLASENSVELLKDYTALLVISQIDNVMFYIAEYGFLGGDLDKAAEKAKSIQIEHEELASRCELIAKMLAMTALLCGLFVPFGIIVEGQQSGRYFTDVYPNCHIADVRDISSIGNGKCEGVYNLIECAFDGGDCTQFNIQYPNCRNALEPWKVGDGNCDQMYNNKDCLFDGNDCCFFATDERLGDGICDGGFFFAEMCQLDMTDCKAYERAAPDCKFMELADLVPFGKEPRLGDGICEGSVYNTPECLFENGDCEVCNSMVLDYTLTGDGTCNGGPYNTEECNYDGGDCDSFNLKYPNCQAMTQNVVIEKMEHFPIIGDGICNSGLYMNEDCGFEDGECNACNELVDDVSKIGNGFCDGWQYMIEECLFDGGDCIDCQAPRFEMGNDWCTNLYNVPECGFDGGDCLDFNDNYIECDVHFPSLLGNGHCNGDEYNTEACQWDGGDCLEFKIDGCDSPRHRHYLLGNGICNKFLNNEECEFDKGDCQYFNEAYPDCVAAFNDVDPSLVGDGVCHGGNYNIQECGFDGGDCLVELL